MVIGNQAPIIDSGVSGNDEPFILVTDETYTVVAHDPDLDPLTYSWTVTNVSTSTEVISDDPGNGDGTIDIDFAAIGAANLDVYDIDCDVTDNIAPPVTATTLQVTCNNILFFDDMESGQGDWLTELFGPNNGWGIVPGGHDANWWHSNSGSNLATASCNMRLWTPELTIPAGISGCELEFYHEVRGWWSANTIWAGTGFIVTEDDGTSVQKVVFPMVSGPQYSNWAYPYTSVYHWALTHGGGPLFSAWGVPAWAATISPTTSVVDLANTSYTDLRGRTIRIGFIYGSGYSGTRRWCVDDVRITITP